MEIKTLKDLKLALKDIPEETLAEFGAGIFEEPYVQLMVWQDESEAVEFWEKTEKKYSQINDIDKWIQNISKISQTDFDDITEEPISSKDKVEDKKSSSTQDKIKDLEDLK